MLLTKEVLKKLLQDWRISIPAELEQELLDGYGHLVQDDERHVFEYTEQDICEQLRKRLYPSQRSQQEVRDNE